MSSHLFSIRYSGKETNQNQSREPRKNATCHKQACRRKALQLIVWGGQSALQTVRNHGEFRWILHLARPSQDRPVNHILIGRLVELHLSVLATTPRIASAWKPSFSSLCSCVSKSAELRTWSNAEKPIDIARARAGARAVGIVAVVFTNSWALMKTGFWRANKTIKTGSRKTLNNRNESSTLICGQLLFIGRALHMAISEAYMNTAKNALCWYMSEKPQYRAYSSRQLVV